eukprot:CAMPEP_0201500428 /NCGR_PEP_ID=MMETSP0151_2-20130828/81463_1 /ASSEMBLY_ACC=CAM_ASM_000257 /TAXON_ID=200890 /ORGANISM="Paramoeba atlantica, Strain 621/1 / CCAP 1560/9" /LENGTH=101 /DNA_ID=CAMNT_0047893645 /DNA_START=27 /DNA_END=328 /DNA_ORIENTATION=+
MKRFLHVKLTTNHRLRAHLEESKDSNFLHVLQKLRKGVLNTDLFNESVKHLSLDEPLPEIPEATYLYFKNAPAQERNDRMLHRTPGPMVRYSSIISDVELV